MVGKAVNMRTRIIVPGHTSDISGYALPPTIILRRPRYHWSSDFRYAPNRKMRFRHKCHLERLVKSVTKCDVGLILCTFLAHEIDGLTGHSAISAQN